MTTPDDPKPPQPVPASSDASARSIAVRYPEMSGPEKAQVALKGDQDGRFQVMREGKPDHLKLLLQNPRITPQEVATLAAANGATLELLQLIGGHRLTAQNEAIRVAIVKNPRTPTPLLRQHIEKLSPGQLAQLGKSPHVRDDVKRLALKLVLNKRG